ncbi:MAG TPA: hypothetical protein VNO26_08170 [Candidatus Limnocylindria bacterium]|nr:hypothetical protein [Candidatus Limnocylindria bacterium]
MLASRFDVPIACGRDVGEGSGRHRAVDRLDGAIAYRPTRNVQAKVQYGYIDQTGSQTQGPQVVAMQLSLQF